MKNLGITKGEAKCYRPTENHNITAVTISEDGVFHTTFITGFKTEQDAQLISDAFNTANKTNMFPSELLEQRDELLAQLTNLRLAFLSDDNNRALAESQKSKELINKIQSNE